MLVLTRKINEEITLQVGDKEITVALVQIRGKQARLGIKAEKDVKILRSEIINKDIKE